MPVTARVNIEMQPRQQRHAGLACRRVGDAVGEQRVDPRPGGEDLELGDAARGGIAVAGGAHVAANLLGDP